MTFVLFRLHQYHPSQHRVSECASFLSNSYLKTLIYTYLSRLTLRGPQGRYQVGVTTFVTPVRPSRPIGSAKLKDAPTGRQSPHNHALFLEEVAFSAYYPADISTKPKKGVPWFIR